MKIGPTNTEILRIAVPAIISNITTPLLGLVDTAITGHLGAAVYIGAIAVGGTMFSMVYWIMNFLRIGTGGLTAQACGAADTAASLHVLTRGLKIAIALALTMIVFRRPLDSLLELAVDADPETRLLSSRYFLIVIFGAPAVLTTYVLNGWMLGMQNSRWPMWMALVTNVVNIIVSLVLVFGASMKIEGVAIGTVTAQYAGVLTGCLLTRRKVRMMIKEIKELAATGGAQHSGVGTVDIRMWPYIKMNVYIILRTLCLVAVTTWFTRVGASMGPVVLAANAVLMQFFLMFSYFMDGFAFAGEALAGKHYGASAYNRLHSAVRALVLWGVGVVVLFTVVYALAGQWIVNILTDDFDVRATARQYLLWTLAVPVAGVLAFIWDGVFIGLVWTQRMFMAMVAALLVFFAAYPPMVAHWGNHGLWMAFILYLATRGVVQTIVYRIKQPC